MKRYFSFFILCFPLLATAQLQYPVTRKDSTVEDYHGTKIADPYRWLEDDRSAETKKWVTEQNKVSFGFLDKISYRADWLKRLEEINNYPKYSLPTKKNEYY